MELVRMLFLAIFGKLAADEAKAWLPRLSQKLLRYAVGRLPHDLRERYREEWQADLESYPGEISRAGRALGLVIAGVRMDISPIDRVRTRIELLLKFYRAFLTDQSRDQIQNLTVMLISAVFVRLLLPPLSSKATNSILGATVLDVGIGGLVMGVVGLLVERMRRSRKRQGVQKSDPETWDS